MPRLAALPCGARRPQPGADAVRHRHQRDEDQQDGRHLGAGEHLGRVVQLLAQPAGADEAQHHRGADRALPAVDGVADQFLRATGQRTEQQRLQPPGAAAQQRLRRRGVGALQDLGVDLAQHPAVGQRDRQHARARSQADHAHQHQRPHEFRHRAQHDQHRPHRPAQRRRPRRHAAAQRRHGQPRRRQQRQRHRDHPGERQPDRRHRHGAPGVGGEHGQELEVDARRQELPGKAHRRAKAALVQQLPGPELAPDQQRPQHDQHGDHEPDPPSARRVAPPRRRGRRRQRAVGATSAATTTSWAVVPFGAAGVHRHIACGGAAVIGASSGVEGDSFSRSA